MCFRSAGPEPEEKGKMSLTFHLDTLLSPAAGEGEDVGLDACLPLFAGPYLRQQGSQYEEGSVLHASCHHGGASPWGGGASRGGRKAGQTTIHLGESRQQRQQQRGQASCRCCGNTTRSPRHGPLGCTWNCNRRTAAVGVYSHCMDEI